MGEKILSDLYNKHTPESSLWLLVYVVEAVKFKLKSAGNLTQARILKYCSALGLSDVSSLYAARNSIVHEIFDVEKVVTAIGQVNVADVSIILRDFGVISDTELLSEDISTLMSWLKELNEKEN